MGSILSPLGSFVEQFLFAEVTAMGSMQGSCAYVLARYTFTRHFAAIDFGFLRLLRTHPFHYSAVPIPLTRTRSGEGLLLQRPQVRQKT